MGVEIFAKDHNGTQFCDMRVTYLRLRKIGIRVWHCKISGFLGSSRIEIKGVFMLKRKMRVTVFALGFACLKKIIWKFIVFGYANTICSLHDLDQDNLYAI